jgi:Holliday junction resolvase RusA-like endonuclease
MPVKRRETGRQGSKTRKQGDSRPTPISWSTARCEATAHGWHFVLPTPERTNAMWRQWKGRTLSSAKHRGDKATATDKFGRLEKYRGDVVVRMVWVRERRSGDIDSRIKAALDLLTAIGVWDDDKRVSDLHVTRVDDDPRAPGLYLWVTPADAPAIAA